MDDTYFSELRTRQNRIDYSCPNFGEDKIVQITRV